jgi:NAD+ kinase
MNDGRTDGRGVWVVGDTTALPSKIEQAPDRETADIVVAVGESALLDLARDGCSTPILPVEAGSGVRSIPVDAVESALQSVRAEESTTIELPILGVDVGGERRGWALMDVMLVTSEAAHISEFALETPTDEIDAFRADGVVVATAAGTSGYASRLGAPVFAPEVEAAAVVPVAAFATALDHWVVTLPDSDLLVEARVTREEAAVSLLLDDRDTGTVPPFTDVTVTVTESLPVLTVPQSPSCFQRSERSPRDSRQQ